AVIVVLGTIMAMSLQITAQTSKQTVNDYLHEQAILLTRSATEYTLLRISAQDRNSTSGCLTALNGTYAPDETPLFDMNVSIRYIGLSGGGALNECTSGENYIQNTDVSDDNSKGSILLDIIVTADESLTTEPIRYHRRTLQKL
ncbi:MAG: type II secretion system protein, partial [Campylobacterota bacterium]|nr:type II secretion system protein [Campylobacterota bacterium]